MAAGRRRPLLRLNAFVKSPFPPARARRQSSSFLRAAKDRDASNRHLLRTIRPPVVKPPGKAYLPQATNTSEQGGGAARTVQRNGTSANASSHSRSTQA